MRGDQDHCGEVAGGWAEERRALSDPVLAFLAAGFLADAAAAFCPRFLRLKSVMTLRT